MKRLLVCTVLAFLFIGCGSTSVDSSSVDSKDDTGDSKNDTGSTNDIVSKMDIPTGFTGSIFYQYLIPSSDEVVKTLVYKNGSFQSEKSLTYTNSSGLVTQRSLVNIDGHIEYQYSSDDTINITLYHDSTTENFSMHNLINVGDLITSKEGTCAFSSYHDNFTFDGKSFSDVVEISCPSSVGYYQKGKGLILENIIDSTLQTSAYEPVTVYPDRRIGGIDSYEPSSNRFSTFNVDSAIAAQVDSLWGSPYSLNGTGVKMGVVDGGTVRDSHVELRNRVTNLSNDDTNLHATHVTGTLISAGTHLATSRGFANQAEVYSISYHDDSFVDSVLRLANNYGVLLSNHSYGFEGPDGLSEYGLESKKLDTAISANPYIISVMASGNDGDEYKTDRDFTKWALIKDGSNAKNIITVAAIDNESNKIASFSSAGPIKGGRLKPDISADGVNVLSTSNWDDTAYKRLYGTSMATPAVTGSIALLSQRYSQVNGANPRVDTIKAIIFNTAVDIENRGPDYKSGFGHLNALSSVQVIDSMVSSDESLVKLDTIHQSENQRYFINSTRYQDFKVTLAWVDDVYSNCSNCANDILMSDIDMYLEEENSGQKIYPYTLSESKPDKDAVKTKANHIDPQEQIEYRLKPGNYTLHINGFKVSSSAQNFTIVSSLKLSDVQKDVVMTPMDIHIHKIYNATK